MNVISSGFSLGRLNRLSAFAGTRGFMGLCLAAMLCLSLSSCKNTDPASKGTGAAKSLPGSGGKTCEIVVVTPKARYEQWFRDSLQHFFMEARPLLNQAEPRFTLVNIPPQAFQDNVMFTHHRNIIGIELSTTFTKPSVQVQYDHKAVPQVIFWFKVASRKQFDSLFCRYKDFIRQKIYDKEYERIQRVFKKNESIDLSRHIEKHYGFSLVFPDGFSIASSRKDFAWIRKESKHFGQGIILHIYPYTDKETFTLSHIIKKRNEVVANIPGPLEGSFMTTETAYPDLYPESRPIQIDGRYAVETRGLWKLQGDFMGGPFVNYVLVDTAQQRVVMMDAYLYSPRKPKRDLLIQMEAIARGLRILPKD